MHYAGNGVIAPSIGRSENHGILLGQHNRKNESDDRKSRMHLLTHEKKRVEGVLCFDCGSKELGSQIRGNKSQNGICEYNLLLDCIGRVV